MDVKNQALESVGNIDIRLLQNFAPKVMEKFSTASIELQLSTVELCMQIVKREWDVMLCDKGIL